MRLHDPHAKVEVWSTIAETYIPDGAATFASTNTVDPNIPDIDKFPHWVEPKNSRVSNPEYFDASLVDQIKTSDAYINDNYQGDHLVEEYKEALTAHPDSAFIMTTGSRQPVYFHSEHRQIPSLRQLTPEPYLEIHPEAAEKLGIKTGDEVTIENPWGSAHEIAKVTPVVRKDVVAAAHGWWYPEEDGEEPNLYGVWKSNVNSLIPHRVLGKMGFGAPYKQVPVKVYRTPSVERVLG